MLRVLVFIFMLQTLLVRGMQLPVRVMNNARQRVTLVGSCTTNSSIDAGEELNVSFVANETIWVAPQGMQVDCEKGCDVCYAVTLHASDASGITCDFGHGPAKHEEGSVAETNETNDVDGDGGASEEYSAVALNGGNTTVLSFAVHRMADGRRSPSLVIHDALQEVKPSPQKHLRGASPLLFPARRRTCRQFCRWVIHLGRKRRQCRRECRWS